MTKTDQTTADLNNIRALVIEISSRVKSIEQEANIVLHTNGDEQGYRHLMRQKAEILASLYETCLPALASLPETPAKDAVQKRLMQFSQSASTALKLDSVFYMSALLYPENHVPGNPNDLELFIENSLTEQPKRA